MATEFQFLLNPKAARLHACSAVLSGYTNGKGPDYRVERYRTTLTIKAVTRGEALYQVGRGRYRVTEETFLILNDGQEYGLEIDGQSRTQTLCPFFERGLVEHVADSMTTPIARQLDEIEVCSPSLVFPERLYPRTGPVALALRELHLNLQSQFADRTWLEDAFFGLARALVCLQGHIEREVADFPGIRPATRMELYKRLHRGRDFLSSCYDEPLTVARVAHVACLSPYHFHRMFKLAFDETPMEFLQARRLERARMLLIRTDLPITAIALSVGFESPSAFSWLFRKRFGLSPRTFRARGVTGPNSQH